MGAGYGNNIDIPLSNESKMQFQLLVNLVSRGSEAYLKELQCPNKHVMNPELVKICSPRLSVCGISRLSPRGELAFF